MAALEQALTELGQGPGRNALLVNRNADQQLGRLPELAAELVRSGVERVGLLDTLVVPMVPIGE